MKEEEEMKRWTIKELSETTDLEVCGLYPERAAGTA